METTNIPTLAPVLERVQRILSEQLCVAVENCTETARLDEDLGADSLDVVELLMELEDEFELAIADEQAEQFRTVGDVVAYIQNNQ